MAVELINRVEGGGPALRGWATAVLLTLVWGFAAAQQLDEKAALDRSQSVVGQPLGQHRLTRTDGRMVSLDDYRGRPVVISMIYTSCYHTCPAITQHLKRAVSAAREALGSESFQVITVGFDAHNDTPEAMRMFAARQKVDVSDWDFLSGTPETIQSLSDALGFTFFPSPRGFDHLTQATIVDADGTIHRQVYGETFALPWLVEPLKQLVFGTSNQHLLSQLIGRVKLFCTVYDPTTGRYEFDYSLFIQMAIGGLIILSGISFLIVHARRT